GEDPRLARACGCFCSCFDRWGVGATARSRNSRATVAASSEEGQAAQTPKRYVPRIRARAGGGGCGNDPTAARPQEAGLGGGPSGAGELDPPCDSPLTSQNHVQRG